VTTKTITRSFLLVEPKFRVNLMIEEKTPAILPQEELDLVALLQNEDTRERGFRELMRKYQERLYWHIRRILPEHEDTNDVLQNTFVKVFRNIANFKGDARIYTWLYRIATNEAITFLNKQKKRTVISLDNDEKVNWDEILPAETPIEPAADILDRLEQAIKLLPEKQRLVFTMRYYDELPYREMSEILGTSEGALKASFHHATKKIEDFLKSR
jgi:RNA polymerase sigma factor (sigma-70 family)